MIIKYKKMIYKFMKIKIKKNQMNYKFKNKTK